MYKRCIGILYIGLYGESREKRGGRGDRRRKAEIAGVAPCPPSLISYSYDISIHITGILIACDTHTGDMSDNGLGDDLFGDSDNEAGKVEHRVDQEINTDEAGPSRSRSPAVKPEPAVNGSRADGVAVKEDIDDLVRQLRNTRYGSSERSCKSTADISVRLGRR